MTRRDTEVLALLGAALLASSPTVSGQDVSHGQLLYENHCTVCHESGVHIRENRKARSLADVSWQIARWQQELKLEWGGTEHRAVLEYLNQTYYGFPVPTESR